MRHHAPEIGIVCILIGFAAYATIAVAAEDALLLQARSVFKKLPKNFADQQHPSTPARVALARALFFDPRWSVDQNVSCATCHNPASYGTDALPKSIGVKGKQHPRNAPTVLNVAGDSAANCETNARTSKTRRS
jgi:cytochrome c peroxidase